MPALARAEQAEIRTARPRTAGRSRASSRFSWVSRHFTGARIDLNEFPDKDILLSADPASRAWPSEGLARVPYWIYQDEDVYRREQERIYRGDAWNFLGLEAELPEKGDFKTTFVGEMPVVVTRDESGAIRCFENRCAHRGALLCLADRGNAKEIACVYHNWTYDLRGDLTAVAFRRGVQGKGGMPLDADPESQAPRKFRVEDPPRDEGTDKDPRRLHSGAAEQLEALLREREGHVPREPLASVFLDLPLESPGAERRGRRRRRGRQPRELHHDEVGSVRRRVRKGRHALGERRLRAAGAADAGIGGRDWRRRHAADPHRVPGIRAAADHEQPRRAPGAAQGRGPHRARVDLLRLCVGRREDDRAPHEAVEPRRPGGVHLTGGRRGDRVRAARRGRCVGAFVVRRDGRAHGRVERIARHRNLGAGPLAAVPQAYGFVRPWTLSFKSPSRTFSPATSTPSTTIGWRTGRGSLWTRAATASPPRRTTNAACRCPSSTPTRARCSPIASRLCAMPTSTRRSATGTRCPRP